MADPLTITDIVGYNSSMNIKVSEITNAVNAGEIPAYKASEFFSTISGQKMKPVRAINGDVLSWVVDETATVSKGNVVNSNASTVSRGVLSSPVSTNVSTSQTATATRLSGVGTRVATFASKLAIPLTLAAVGITLGKTIDETLYNANPEFWNNLGMETLNPQTWNSLAGGNELGESFINALFGIDPNTGDSQAYINQDALAYLAYVMQNGGVFGQGESGVFDYGDTGWTVSGLPLPFDVIETDYVYWIDTNSNYPIIKLWFNKTVTLALFVHDRPGYDYRSLQFVAVCDEPFGYNMSNFSASYGYDKPTTQLRDSSVEFTFNDLTVNFKAIGTSIQLQSNPLGIPFNEDSGLNLDATDSSGIPNRKKIAWLMKYNCTTQPLVEGIGNQTGATIPNFTGLTEEQYLPYLQQSYPDMFDNAITDSVIQDDGTVKQVVYVPITLPESSNPTETQPISGGQTQTNPSVNPSTSTETLIELITKMLQQPFTQPITDTPTPPENPTDTGDGGSPSLVAPTGSASALWKIYHPTQAQIDSFGGWLWSSNFIDQILKIFNNPMEAVIGLHKVYATPIDAGTATIKVGYLDSEVPSAYIEQQYIEISCGSVNLGEQFGNVFDYSPFTDVQLYLPFVGIVPLNVADVMRSTISITYGVDVITGACLAQVEVSRDAQSSVLYQYSGNCAVQYPISSGSYMGIVSSIISVAGGVAATAASGGAVAPLALGAAGGLFNAHTSVQHSGGFSGNAGAMGCKIPYLIITRPQTKVAFNAESMQGYPTNNYVTVGECSGYIKADSVHVINVNATDEELNEINNLLINGIII